jgi:hypothetical protein
MICRFLRYRSQPALTVRIVEPAMLVAVPAAMVVAATRLDHTTGKGKQSQCADQGKSGEDVHRQMPLRECPALPGIRSPRDYGAGVYSWVLVVVVVVVGAVGTTWWLVVC